MHHISYSHSLITNDASNASSVMQSVLCMMCLYDHERRDLSVDGGPSVPVTIVTNLRNNIILISLRIIISSTF